MNWARGEVALVGTERTYCLCLTLGALAELEAVFGVKSFKALAERLRAFSHDDLMLVLEALLRGGGEDAVAQNIRTLNVPASEAARAVAEAFQKAFV